MPVTISSTLAVEIVARAAATPDVEVCGLLLGTYESIKAIVPAENVADAPRTRFEVDPRALLSAHRAARSGGLPVVGNYHSHPSGLMQPSSTDAAMIGALGEIWLIVADGALNAWRATADRSFEAETLVLA